MPNTREKLIEICRRYDSTPPCDTCETPIGSCSMCGLERLIDYLIANGVTVQEWISVKDRLPEHKGNYLGFTGSTTMVGYYKGNGTWWIWLNDREGENLFTHWMPLPPVPEEE